MLDSLLKSKFYNKCKTNLKLIKTCVQNKANKKNTVQKILKNDIADLLRNGLDKKAYDRAGELLTEQNISRCYEFVDNFCGNISSNLSLMQKQKECPEECREAVASLIYAAARFAEPGLRDLRNMFTERYGNSLQTYTNKEFMERLSPGTSTKETKLQLLQDIANEFSIEWDSKALEQELFTPPTTQNQAVSVPMNDKDKDNNGDGEKYTASHRRSKEDGFPRRRNPAETGNRVTNLKQYNIGSEGSETDRATRRGKDRYYLHPSIGEDEPSTATDFSQDNRKTSSSSAGSISWDDAVDSSSSSRRPFPDRIRPPPYLKPKPEKNRSEQEKEEEEDTKPKPGSVRRWNKSNTKLPPPPGHDNPRRGGPRTEDEEERVIDGLLTHYSNKRSPYEAAAAGEPSSRHIRGRRPEPALPPARAASLPPEPTTSAAEAAETRGPARAVSFQPDGHIHPKLPGDYTELAARIAALRAKESAKSDMG